MLAPGASGGRGSSQEGRFQRSMRRGAVAYARRREVGAMIETALIIVLVLFLFGGEGWGYSRWLG